MFKSRRSSSGRGVVYFLSGRIDEEAVPELQRLLELDVAALRVILDLEDVRHVDAEAVEFFARCEDVEIELRHCPPFVREWIAGSRRHG